MKCGLLGRKLSHSYSPEIHRMFGGYGYAHFEREPEDVGAFLSDGAWDGINVTIPYKKTVLPFVTELSETAKAAGSVNTLKRLPDGGIYGDNTDVFGFTYLLRHSGVPAREGKALVLGSGGASVAVVHALKSEGFLPVVISRNGENNYTNLDRHADAVLIVNATPVGMYPENGKAPLSLKGFPKLEGVIDIIYNPAKTALLLEAEALGLPYANGLLMLVAQAAKSSEIFTGTSVEDRIQNVTKRLAAQKQNIVLIGMPGSGKTTVGRLLSKATGRELFDSDEVIVETAGVPIPEIFEKEGETGFRKRESEALAALGKLSGTILSTGGGCVTVPENLPYLRENSTVFWIRRELGSLAREGRPLSRNADLSSMYERRAPLYQAAADHVIDNNASPERAAEAILNILNA